ncbi:hypothetical protein OSTOST_12394 [Ostertagia ostertagi]
MGQLKFMIGSGPKISIGDKGNFLTPFIQLGAAYFTAYGGRGVGNDDQNVQWKPKVMELRMRQEWAEIMGKTIAKYTRDVSLRDKKLTIYTDVAALKQELMFGKEQLINKLNAHFEETVVTDIIVK